MCVVLPHPAVTLQTLHVSASLHWDGHHARSSVQQLVTLDAIDTRLVQLPEVRM